MTPEDMATAIASAASAAEELDEALRIARSIRQAVGGSMNPNNVDAAIAAASDTLGAEYSIFAPTAYLDVAEQVVQVMRGRKVVAVGRGATVAAALKDALKKWNEGNK